MELVVLDQGIDTSTAAGRIFFQMLGSIAEFEGALASERTLDGLAAARRRSRIGGRKPKLGARQIDVARQMYDQVDETGQNKFTMNQIAAEFGVTRPAIYDTSTNRAPCPHPALLLAQGLTAARILLNPQVPADSFPRHRSFSALSTQRPRNDAMTTSSHNRRRPAMTTTRAEPVTTSRSFTVVEI